MYDPLPKFQSMEGLATQLLPCDSNGECMVCKKATWEKETLTCNTCATPWHLPCLGTPIAAHTSDWECPDCYSLPNQSISARSHIAPAVDTSEHQKGKTQEHSFTLPNFKEDDVVDNNQILELFEESLKCSFCMQLPQSPVTILCGHNFCLKCFQKWVGQGKRTCAKCRSIIPSKIVSSPRVNSSLSVAIQIAKSSPVEGTAKACDFLQSQNQPDKAYSHESAKKAGKKTAFRENIFVTVPPDHFGPILAVNDPRRKQGVLVGETWENWIGCRQWGAHVSHNEGISGQADYGVQSVALSCGKEDDEDHGDWFIYTGSDERVLLECEETCKRFHQKLETYNKALRVSFEEGYPVRVVRLQRKKLPSYAPKTGIRYDGIYRIEKCWLKVCNDGFKVPRYLFVRCDNDPAPWSSGNSGDRPRSLPNIKELKTASEITERKESPSWGYNDEKERWMWLKAPPLSGKQANSQNVEVTRKTRKTRRTHANSMKDRLLKEFRCLICWKVMVLPLTTPCAHNFCKSCLLGAFAGHPCIRQRNFEGWRTLRVQKNIMKCPSCSNDIFDFLQNPQVNTEMMNVVKSLLHQGEVENNVEAIKEMPDKCENIYV